MSVKTDEFEGRSAGSINDSLNISVGDTNRLCRGSSSRNQCNEISNTSPSFAVPWVTRITANYKNQKSPANFLATFANIFIQWEVMDGSTGPLVKRVLRKMMLGFIVRRCAADIGHTPTPISSPPRANGASRNGIGHCLFGKPISASISKSFFVSLAGW